MPVSKKIPRGVLTYGIKKVVTIGGLSGGGVDLLLTQSQASTCRVFLAVCRLPTRADGSRTPICGSDGSEAIMISSVFRV